MIVRIEYCRHISVAASSPNRWAVKLHVNLSYARENACGLGTFTILTSMKHGAASALDQMKTKVLHFLESGGMYGAENVILNLSREMRQSGVYEPIIGCIVQNHREAPALCEAARNQAIRAEQFHIKNTWLPLHYVGFIRRLAAIRPDIIHCHGYKASVYAYPAGRILGIPVTATCHLWYIDDRSPLTMRLLIRLEKALYRRFPVVFAVSPAIRESLISAGVSAMRVHVVNNGVPLPTSNSYDASSLPQLAAQFGISPGDVCIVNTGRLTHQKAQKTIVDAARLLKARRRRFQFIIAGEGELRDELRQYIAHSGLVDDVRLIGFSDRIADLLSVATVFVLPSRDEGMPMSLLESVAGHVPVVATDVGAVGTVIKDRISGRLISPDRPAELAAAIEEIVDNPSQGKSYSERAYELLKSTYSSAAMFSEYDRYYQWILKTSAKS
jgi:glycosyltransferase involved in cell wall biosynthesis